MLITAVRHGETIDNKNHIIQGQIPGKLSPAGIRQAEDTALELSNQRFDYIYSSDLYRCRQTASIIQNSQKYAALRYTAELREFNFGVYQGMSKKDLDWRRIKHDALERPMPGGESWPELSGRIIAFIKDIEKDHRGERILLVTHRCPIRVMKAYFGNISLDKLISDPVPNGCILRFDTQVAATLRLA